MATRDEKETLDQIKKDLAKLAVEIMAQADAVTDKVTRVRLSRKAQEAWKISDRIGALVE